MLLRLTADQRLEGIKAMLETWNAEADRFRAASVAARAGESPSSVLVAAAEEAHDGLFTLIEEIDRTLETLPAGHKDFAALLQAQKVAVSLAEHISTSLDGLERFATAPEKAAVRIVHAPKLAAAE